MKKIRIGTDCSGIEAPVQALIKLGIDFDHVFACDIDKYVKQVSEKIYQPEHWFDDLMQRDNTNAPKVDLYVAGFPCQAFSIAGKRKGFDDIRGSVFFGVADYIRQTRPEVFILENVKGLLSHDKGRTFQTVLDVLAGNGTINGQMSIPYYDDGLDYNLYWDVLNTKNFGVPQNRERVFLVGFREPRRFRWPKPVRLNLKLKDLLELDVDPKYFLSQKMIEGFKKHKIKNDKKGNGFGWNPSDGDRVAYTIKCKAGSQPEDNYIITDGFINQDTQASQVFNENGLSPTLGAFTHGYAQGYVRTHSLYPQSSKTGKGGSGHLSKDDGTAYALDTGNNQAVELNMVGKLPDTSYNDLSRRVYDADGLGRTLMGSGGSNNDKAGQYLVDSRIRRLTPLECFRLQGFPDFFHQRVKAIGISDTQRYKMAGNSMTVDVMAAIIDKIYNNGIQRT